MSFNKKLNIVHISAECAPYAKSGGLGDVVQQLPTALVKQGHQVSTIIPDYGFFEKTGLNKELILDDVSVTVRGKIYKSTLSIIKDQTSNPIFLIGNQELFGDVAHLYTPDNDGLRFLFFDVAALTMLNILLEKKIAPFQNGIIDIIHCHDWHAGIIPQLIKTSDQFLKLKNVATVCTIHNLAYQGQINWWHIPPRRRDRGTSNPLRKTTNPQHLNFLRRAIIYADVVNTVSERYALEILTKEFGQGLNLLLRKHKNKVYGIVNGIDYNVWNPQFDPNVYVNFDVHSLEKKKENKKQLQQELGLNVDADTALIGIANRLTEQKGFDLIMELMPDLLEQNLQIVVVGDGEKGYLRFFRKMAKKYPTRVGISSPFCETIASKVYAGSDMYLMPSHFEPCGISQLISLRYGSVPIVHETGGLHDTITDFNYKENQGNGFSFPSYNAEDLAIAIGRALETYQNKPVWEALMARGMEESFSWDLPASKYVNLYSIATNHEA